MKRYYTALLLALTLFSGCLRQDFSICGIPDNCVLVFRLEDDKGKDRFEEKISSIDALVFDSRNRLVIHKRVDREMLDESNSLRLTVEPGEYRVICWANVSSNSTLSVSGDNAYLEECYLEVVSSVTGCPLYYAPKKEPGTRSGREAETRTGDYSLYTVTIPPNTVTEKELWFGQAHRTVNIYTAGMDQAEGFDNRQPTVQLTNIPYRYDLLLCTDSSRKNYQRQSEPVETPQGIMSLATFRAPIADFSEDMVIHIRNTSDGNSLYTLNLKEYVENNDIPDINNIDILVVFGINASVTVTLPPWNEQQVKPIR